jgi:hypothetical protein
MALRPALAPRLLILAGMAIIVLSVTGVLSPTLTAGAQILGGLLALAGLAWFLIGLRRGV